MDEFEERQLLELVAFLAKATKQNSDMILKLSDILLEVEQTLLDFIKLQEQIVKVQVKK